MSQTKFVDDDGCEITPYWDFDGKRVENSARMLAELLLDEAVFINSRKYQCIDGSQKDETLVVFVICNDIFAWACADSESVTLKELPSLYDAHAANKKWGTARWCALKRNQRPQWPVERDMKSDGVWDDQMEALPRNTSHDACCATKAGETP